MTAKTTHYLILTLMLVNGTAAQTVSTKSQPLSSSKTNSQTKVNGRWYVFNAPDKDFVVEFPAKPKREPDDEAPSGTMRGH